MAQLVIKLEINTEYGELDASALSEVQEYVDDNLPSYIDVSNSSGEEVSIEVSEIVSVTVEENEEWDRQRSFEFSWGWGERRSRSGANQLYFLSLYSGKTNKRGYPDYVGSTYFGTLADDLHNL